MRLTKLFPWMLLCGFVAFSAVAAHAQQAGKVAGYIVVAKVRGSVTAKAPDGTTRTLANNDRISEKYVVDTGAASSAILVFSNGATLNIGPDSELAIETFLQDPFNEGAKLSDLSEEPSTSVTSLKLERGELVGDVKHLHREQGSSFEIKTPVGAAGIRGTTFRIVFKPDANGKVFFTLATETGEVLFSAPAAEGVSVPSQQEVSVTVDATVDTTTGQITINTPPAITSTTTISAENKAAIATSVTEIVAQASQVILDSTADAEKAAAEKAAAEKAAAEKAAAEKAAAEKAAAEKAAAEKAAAEKAAAEKAAAEKAAAEKAAAEKAAAEKAAAEKAAESNNPQPNSPEQQTTSGDGL